MPVGYPTPVFIPKQDFLAARPAETISILLGTIAYIGIIAVKPIRSFFGIKTGVGYPTGILMVNHPDYSFLAPIIPKGQKPFELDD